MRSGLISLFSPEGSGSDITDMASTLTLNRLDETNDGDVYVCYLEAYNSGLRTLLQPVTLYLNKIEGISATYTGEPVVVSSTSEYSKDDVTVIATMTDDTNVPIDSADWTEDSLIVDEKGDNTYTATVETFTDNFTVPGLVKTTLSAEYNGGPIRVSEDYSKDDVEVTLTQLNDDDTPYGNDIILASDDWSASGLTVLTDGDNTFTATYTDQYIVNGSVSGNYIVPGFYRATSIEADYTGDKVPVGSDYTKSDVTVKVNYENNTNRYLDVTEWSESGLTVSENGINTFTATFQDLTDTYDVTGYRPIDHIYAVYTGPEIETGNTYSKDDVEVRACYTSSNDEDYVTLDVDDWDVWRISVEEE